MNIFKKIFKKKKAKAEKKPEQESWYNDSEHQANGTALPEENFYGNGNNHDMAITKTIFLQ
jgi:hypothetical protein